MTQLSTIHAIAASRANDIRNYLDTDFEKELFDAVIENLLDLKNTLRLNNFAYAAREFIRIYLDNRADEKSIKLCTWYDTIKSSGKITRRDRMHYIIHKGLSPKYVLDELCIDIDATIKSLLDDIDILSKYTHISNTFNQNTSNNKIAISLFDSLWSFIDTIEKTKKRLCDYFESQISELANNTFVYEFFDDIDMLSTHSSITEAYIYSINLVHIDDKQLKFEVSGELTVDLQWGSDSDIKRGDGATAEESVPFSMEIQAEIGHFEEFEVITYDVDVDD